MLRCRVLLLDDTYIERDLEKKAIGQVLFDNVCEYLNLLEKDYFGLASWESSNTKVWLDVSKEICKQHLSPEATFTFNVKFYPPDPSLLAEDITRYLLCLQLRTDILTGRLPCPSDTFAVLGSYTMQSEFGDYNSDLHGKDFLNTIPLAPDQTPELEQKVTELYSTYKSMSPVEADKLFLQSAKTLPLYGVHLHSVKDVNGADVMLSVCAEGLLVYEDGQNTETFPWSRILKMSYKRCNFHARIRHTQDSSESTITYILHNYCACKCLWKNAVEHHAFFRNHRQDKVTVGLLPFSSRFCLRGLTQDEALKAGNNIKREVLQFAHAALRRKAKENMLVALKCQNRTDTDDWFQILGSDQCPTYPEITDIDRNTKIDNMLHKENDKEADLVEEMKWFKLLGRRFSPIQLSLTSVTDILDSAVLKSWKKNDDDWFILLEPSTFEFRFLPLETPPSGEEMECEDITSEVNEKFVKTRKEVQTIRKGFEELELEPSMRRPDIAGKLDTEANYQNVSITEENLVENKNEDGLQEAVVFQQRTHKQIRYMGTPHEDFNKQRFRGEEILKKLHKTVLEESDIVSEETIEELKKKFLEVETIEQKLQEIEKLSVSLQELTALQQQVELEGRRQGERDNWHILLDPRPMAVPFVPAALKEMKSEALVSSVVEEVKVLEDEWKWEEERARQIRESAQLLKQEWSQKEVDDGWFAMLDVSPKEIVRSRVVHNHEVTREENEVIKEQVTLIFEEITDESRGEMIETPFDVVQLNPVVQKETDNWFLLLDPIPHENRIIPSVPVAEVFEDIVIIKDKEVITEEKPTITKERQIKTKEVKEVQKKNPVVRRKADDSWFGHFDPTPFEKRSVSPVAPTEINEETVGLKTQQRLTVKQKEETTVNNQGIIKKMELQMKAGEVENKIPFVRREIDDSWFVVFDQIPFQKRRVATVPLTGVCEETAGPRTQQRGTTEKKELISKKSFTIITEKQVITEEVGKKIPVMRHEVDDTWFELFEPTLFVKQRVDTVTSDTILEERTVKDLHKRRLKEEERKRRKVEERRPHTRVPVQKAKEQVMEVPKDWFILLEVQPTKSDEPLLENRVESRKRKARDVKESVPVSSPMNMPKVLPLSIFDQPLTSTPTEQHVRITGSTNQEESLMRLNITQDVTGDITQESKVENVSVIIRKRKEKKIEGETIYIRHSILMLEDSDVTQEVVLRHHASVSELKRLFMEDIPVCVPTEWEKRLSTHTPVIIPQLSNGEWELRDGVGREILSAV